MLERAVAIAKKAFSNKFDKAGEPYIGHLLRVTERIPDSFDIEEMKVVAMLHDLLEDCPEWNADLLKENFSERIVDSIIALTHKEEQSYDDYISPILLNKWAIIVKKADLEDNMDMTRLKIVSEKDKERFEKYQKAYKRILLAIEINTQLHSS
jgi:GTP diphosphokinase / guanosine-3',5'-bis(diphosphate) 3'-diphosphatase